MAENSGENASKASVFLSYSRKDAIRAQSLRARLENAGISVFRDIDDTLIGEQWWARITQLIAEADTIVFLLSPHSASSSVCVDEVAHALALNKRVFPAVIEPVDWAKVPPGLAKVHSIDLRDDERLDEAVARLVSALMLDIGWIREHTRLLDRARHWSSNNRDASELLSGDPLEEAELWLMRRPLNAPAPTALHQEYVKASRDALRARQEQRLNEAEQQRQVIEAERDRAARNLNAATETASNMAREVSAEFRYAPLRYNGLIRRVVDRSQTVIDDLLKSGTDFPAAMAHGAGGLLAIAEFRGTLDEVEAALATAERARSIAADLVSLQPGEPTCGLLHAQASATVAAALARAGQHETALAEFRNVAEACASKPPGAVGNSEWLSLTAKARIGHGDAHLQAGATSQAVSCYADAEAIADQIASAPSAESGDHTTLRAIALTRKGCALARGQQLDAAVDTLLDAAGVWNAKLRQFPADRGAQVATSECQEALGDAYRRRSEYLDACDAYVAGYRLMESAAGSDQEDERWASALVRCKEKIGQIILEETLLQSFSTRESFSTMQLYEDLRTGAKDQPKRNMHEIIHSPEAAIRRAENFMAVRQGKDKQLLKFAIDELAEARGRLRRPLSDPAEERRRQRALSWIDKELAALRKL